MGKRTLTGENARKRAAAANSLDQAGPRKSNNNGAVKNTNRLTTTKGRHNQTLPSDDDVDEDNGTNFARSTGSNDVAELIGLLQSKTKKSSSKFNEFEHEQRARLEKAREMIDGESGIITVWTTEMEEITSNVKRKVDDRLEREDEYIKKLKLEFEKYQSATTETLDNLTKLQTQTQKLGRDLHNNLKQLYATNETELNEALEQFIKQQKHVHKILLHTNKKNHDITTLKERLSG